MNVTQEAVALPGAALTVTISTCDTFNVTLQTNPQFAGSLKTSNIARLTAIISGNFSLNITFNNSAFTSFSDSIDACFTIASKAALS